MPVNSGVFTLITVVHQKLCSFIILHVCCSCQHDYTFLVLFLMALHFQASGLVVAVDDDGRFIDKISEFRGRCVKEADKDMISVDKDIISAVKASSFSAFIGLLTVENTFTFSCLLGLFNN